MRLVAATEIKAKAAEKLTQRGKFFFGGAFMHAIQHRLAVFRQKIRGAHVGRQHALFDHAMRIVALDRHDALDLALLVKNDFGFGGLEINRAAFGARFYQLAE